MTSGCRSARRPRRHCLARRVERNDCVAQLYRLQLYSTTVCTVRCGELSACERSWLALTKVHQSFRPPRIVCLSVLPLNNCVQNSLFGARLFTSLALLRSLHSLHSVRTQFAASHSDSDFILSPLTAQLDFFVAPSKCEHEQNFHQTYLHLRTIWLMTDWLHFASAA